MHSVRSLKRSKRRFSWAMGLVVLAGLLGGCALMHDDPDAPAATPLHPEQVRLASDIRLARDGWPEARWWTRYGDPQLDALIERALQSAPTMTIARIRVHQSRSQVDLTRAGSNLQVLGFASLNGQYTSSNGFLGPYAKDLPLLGLTGPWYTEGTLGVFATLNLDLWGKDRATVNASIGLHNARIAEAAAAELELSTQIAHLYYGMQVALASLALQAQSLDAARFVAQAHEARAARGLESRLAFESARARQFGIEQQMAQTHGQVTQLREALRALVGAGADDFPEIASRPLPASMAALPGELSYALLARRPDLQALRWTVQSSLQQIEVAKAAFYPSFNIKALYALDSLHLDKLFRSDSQQFNLLPGLTLPLFDSGLLNANLRGARAANSLLIAQYNQAVLGAVRDVASSASRLQALAQEQKLQAGRLRAVQFQHDAAQATHDRGLANLQAVTESRLAVIAEQSALLSLDAQWLDQEISLTKALGGGYQSEDNKAGLSPAENRISHSSQH